MQLSVAEASRFYAEHDGRSFFQTLMNFVTGDPVVALALRKVDAIHAWRTLAGPTKTDVAKQQAPNSLRALYGTDGTRNAVHGSDSVRSAKRELLLIFPDRNFTNPTVPLRIIIAGAPASGKGTQCELIREKYGVVHLSTGDMLRAGAAAHTQVGLEAKAYMDSGRLVPDELIISVVKERLHSKEIQERGFLLDGFPRTPAQAVALAAAGVQVDHFLFVDVPDAILVERVLGRRLDELTGHIYHLKFNPPPNDPELLKRLVHRADDTEESIQVRLGSFHQYLQPIVEQYKSVFTKIRGDLPKDQVFEQIVKTLA